MPEIASLADLRALADSGETFYWAGVRSRTRIELAAPDGTVFIRYLPLDEPAGSTAPALTVATYPRSNAFDEVSRAAEGEDATELELPRGGLAVADDIGRHERPPRLPGPAVPGGGLLAPARRGAAPRRERDRQALLLGAAQAAIGER